MENKLDLYEEIKEEQIDNSHISYEGVRLFLRLNSRSNSFEERRNKLKGSLRKIKRQYPYLFRNYSGDNELQHVIDNIFQEGVNMKLYITNLTFGDSLYKQEVLSIRPKKDGGYLKEALPKGVTLNFRGHVDAGYFVIDEVQGGPDNDYRNFEIEVEAKPYHTNVPSGYRDTFLREILDESNSLTLYTEKQLRKWEQYLEWRKEIVKIRISGCKYFNIDFNYETNEFIFYLVCENEGEFNKFKRHLRKDVQVFDNDYSKDRWRFEFAGLDSKKQINGVGIEVGKYKGIVESFYLGERVALNTFILDEVAFTEIEDEDYVHKEGEDSLYMDLVNEFHNPYIVKVAYEMRNEYIEELENYETYEDKRLYLEDKVVKEYNEEGFLALSSVGEFVLLSRLENAIKKLKMHESSSPNLALWLFDINKANLPTEEDDIESIEWLNKSIEDNVDQMSAVKKILSAQDVCLIQGPPGTGKTTVIAEAVYQFVVRGNRVLIASQSNDAVDNALDRLPYNPSIRALRLGQKSRKKRLKDEILIGRFSEENSIEYFYTSLSKAINDKWVDKGNIKQPQKYKAIKDIFGETLIKFKAKLDDKENYEYDREYYERIYIKSCNVIGISCTDDMRALSDRGYDDFDVVIIDEVSKATPPELLIPLMKGKKVILVGDHRQLPPLFNEHKKAYSEMVNSFDEEDEVVNGENFYRFKDMVTASLFKSYFENAHESIKHSLITQYRMHSDIMRVINRFYDGKLSSGVCAEDELKKHELTIDGINGTSFLVPEKHAYWIDSSVLPNGEPFYESRIKGSTSTENILECYLIIALLKKMADEYKIKGYGKDNQKYVGVISFYQLQVSRIRNMLKEERKNFDFSSINIEVNTVDRFQGKEKEIIITSLVRSVNNDIRSKESYIAAFERINVAFSRAQNLLVIIGAKDMYSKQPVTLPNIDSAEEKTIFIYRDIMEDLNSKHCFFGSDALLNNEDSEGLKVFMEKEYRDDIR